MTQNRLKELLHYDPETGVFTWLWNDSKPLQINKRDAGREAGNLHKSKRNVYKRIHTDGGRYMAHRLAWLYVYGCWPDGEIDHIDGDGLNNRVDNLRAVSKTENLRNMPRYMNNTSGIVGVSWRASRQYWIAQMNINGKRKQVKSSKDFFEAVCARKSAENRLGYHVNHGR